MLDAIAEAAPFLAEGKDATFANKVHLKLNPGPAKPNKPKDAETKDSGE